MRRVLVFVVLWCVAFAVSGVNEAVVKVAGGVMRLSFLDDNAVRVEYVAALNDTLPEWVYVPEGVRRWAPRIVGCGDGRVEVSAGGVRVSVDTADVTVTVADASGRVVLRDAEPALTADGGSVAWINGVDEHLYGMGQFQDGFTDIKGLSRRLTQVNTQIAIPFVLSNKGYGVLWNNYGLTEFNPCELCVGLQRVDEEGEAHEVDVTTTEGARKEVRRESGFEGFIDIPEDGDYAVMMDVGVKMARRHNLSIDGKVVMNQQNLWLPPTSSTIVWLGKGRHVLSANLEKGDRPTVGVRKVDGRTMLRSPMPRKVDFTVFTGRADEVVASYRSATGGCPMMPLWALGYIHCRERFHTQDELTGTAAEFRRRGIPVDVMVQDWQYWGRHGWNSMQFDEELYPDVKAMVDSLHGMNMRLMLSVWSKIDPNSQVGREAKQRGYYIAGTEWIDFFNADASRFYWENFSARLLRPYGIDAWWQDATEPENDDLAGRRVMGGRYAGELFRNVYPLLVCRTVYEGCRRDVAWKRTMILTRSGFPGIQRYGAAMWTGDVGNDWETFRRQIASGLSMAASGMPWWTYDAGGFFRPGNQYSNGEYIERMIRWIQAGAFMPLMRVHGFMSDTEPWRYGAEAERIIRNAIEWRYRLLPYLYSLSRKVSCEGYTMMRPLVFDYPDDERALAVKYDYMLGGNLMVLPVTEPSIRSRRVYLPATEGGWYSLYDGAHVAGGGETEVAVTIENIPVYVKAGSILPLSRGREYAGDGVDEPMDIAVYGGSDGAFALYEDEGDNYNYEAGAFSIIDMKWDDDARTLRISSRRGSYPGMSERRRFNVLLNGELMRTVEYSGSGMEIKL